MGAGDSQLLFTIDCDKLSDQLCHYENSICSTFLTCWFTASASVESIPSAQGGRCRTLQVRGSSRALSSPSIAPPSTSSYSSDPMSLSSSSSAAARKNSRCGQSPASCRDGRKAIAGVVRGRTDGPDDESGVVWKFLSFI